MEKMISKLQYITDCPNLAEQACKGGCDWIQLRVKNKPYNEWKNIAIQFKKICVRYGATLIINDCPEIALDVLSEGVHLGKEDMNILKAKSMLGANYLIGATANTFEDIKAHANAQVDYIGLGPFRFTSTKKNLSPLLGIEGYERIMKQCHTHHINIPIIAIGGIKEGDIENILKTGVHGVAVSSAISNDQNPEEKTKNLLNLLNRLVSK
jgi:thiamine-phosphate pyrophosphorylase